MVLNVEEATIVTGSIDRSSDVSSGFEGWAINLTQVDCGNRSEGGSRLCNFAERRFRSRVKVYILTIVLVEGITNVSNLSGGLIWEPKVGSFAQLISYLHSRRRDGA